MLVTDILLSVRSLKILTRGFWAVVLINLAHSQRKNFESSEGYNIIRQIWRVILIVWLVIIHYINQVMQIHILSNFVEASSLYHCLSSQSLTKSSGDSRRFYLPAFFSCEWCLCAEQWLKRCYDSDQFVILWYLVHQSKPCHNFCYALWPRKWY